MKSPCATATADRIRRVFGVVAAAAIALLAFVGAAATASAATSAATTAAEACPYEYFCIYGGPNFTGKMYALYYCHDYPVAFPGVGSWINNQTPGTRAVISYRDGSKYITIGAPEYSSSWYWPSVADVKPC